MTTAKSQLEMLSVKAKLI